MTLPLLMLLGFAAWTHFVLLVGVGVRRWLLIFRGQANLTCFPGDIAHGNSAYRRAMRAHANCVENLPVFAAIILVGSIAHLNPPHMDGLAVTTLVARVVQSCVHMLLQETNATIALRFISFLVQVLAMAAVTVLLAMMALRSSIQ